MLLSRSHRSLDANVRSVYRMAVKYDVHYLMMNCEMFLDSTGGIPLIEKLAIADELGKLDIRVGAGSHHKLPSSLTHFRTTSWSR